MIHFKLCGYKFIVLSDVIGGKWSPQVGKFGGTGGRSAWVPTWNTKFIPITMWNKK